MNRKTEGRSENIKIYKSVERWKEDEEWRRLKENSLK